ncbi:50S ribosomal protein L23 [candidate division WWE3 bacterium RIFCSPLOWO2_01_FULL_39_13]|uniref:Large ribosomal subunit protein uL23 n=1 Tax=candidate division WWE3 bacterium RIFCSPLOWO2_01_FULL_39_13 TaxID=1802624 RepID=A0A1F4V4N9_UNCKA|nr:MAG: 50S ribosomal protein L23 [candidate division WWE3 bacterium RIFCSPLOWO2_01_FULL_39_13]
MEYKKILKSPVMTEKSKSLTDTGNKYTFKVVSGATKGQVKKIVEDLYKVKVVGINSVSVKGKTKRSWSGKRKEYQRKDYKKVVVQLSEKDTIKIFDEGKK